MNAAEIIYEIKMWQERLSINHPLTKKEFAKLGKFMADVEKSVRNGMDAPTPMTTRENKIVHL